MSNPSGNHYAPMQTNTQSQASSSAYDTGYYLVERVLFHDAEMYRCTNNIIIARAHEFIDSLRKTLSSSDMQVFIRILAGHTSINRLDKTRQDVEDLFAGIGHYKQYPLFTDASTSLHIFMMNTFSGSSYVPIQPKSQPEKQPGKQPTPQPPSTSNVQASTYDPGHRSVYKSVDRILHDDASNNHKEYNPYSSHHQAMITRSHTTADNIGLELNNISQMQEFRRIISCHKGPEDSNRTRREVYMFFQRVHRPDLWGVFADGTMPYWRSADLQLKKQQSKSHKGPSN
ncbi:MAG: hypothetical protein Q9220_006283 [cf. Caloplaca sp. 1 TL-2023]